MPDPTLRSSVLRRYRVAADLTSIENAVLLMSTRELHPGSLLYQRRGRDRQYFAFTKAAGLWGFFATCAAQTGRSVEEIVAGVVERYRADLAFAKLSEDGFDLDNNGMKFYLDSLRNFSGLPGHKSLSNEALFLEAAAVVQASFQSLEAKSLIIDPAISRKSVFAVMMAIAPLSFNHQTQKGHTYVVRYSAALADIEFKGGDDATALSIDLRLNKITALLVDSLAQQKQRVTRNSDAD